MMRLKKAFLIFVCGFIGYASHVVSITTSVPAIVNIAGIPDKTFGTNGIVVRPFTIDNGLTFDFFSQMELPRTRSCVDAQRRSLVTISSLGVILVVRLIENGTLDTTFGANGVVYTYPPDVTQEHTSGLITSSTAISIDRQGRVLVAGFVFNTDRVTSSIFNTDCIVVRYTTNGVLDTTFGKNGIARIAVGHGYINPRSIACDYKDRIVVAGSNTKYGETNSQCCFIRLLSDGSLDRSFGKKREGFVLQSFLQPRLDFNVFEIAREIKFDSYNRMVMVGNSSYSDITDHFSPSKEADFIVLARFKDNGQLDSTFGESKYGLIDNYSDKKGYAKLQITPIMEYSPKLGGYGFVFDRLQRIIVVGTGTSGTDYNAILYPVIVRYDQDGKLDRTFGAKDTNGIVKSKIAYSSNGFGIALDTRGKILIVGDWSYLDQSDPDFNNHHNVTGFVVSRFSSDGILDTTFGLSRTGQVLTTVPGTNILRSGGIVLDGSGRVIVFGATGSILVFDEDEFEENRDTAINFNIVRYASDYELLFRKKLTYIMQDK